MHPLLHLLASRPHLLAEHAQAYGELAGAEMARASAHWKRQAALGILLLVSAGTALVLSGVALMLWASLPSAQMPQPWVLVATPLVPAIAALACGIALRSADPAAAFDELRRQMRADMDMLREAGAA